MGKWKRPDSVPFPSVWHRFEGKQKINGVLPKLWVQDIPEDLYETAIDIMCEAFLKDEPMCKYINVYEDPLAHQDSRILYQNSLSHRLGLMCFMENPDPNGKPIIAGLNMTELCTKDDPPPKITSKKLGRVIGALNEIYKVKDPFETFGINEYMGAMGLVVKPEFRGQAIGLEILKARKPLCKAVGLKMTLTHFTSTASQKLAEKCGFKTLIEISYAELKERNPNLHFPNIEEHTKSIKYMYLHTD